MLFNENKKRQKTITITTTMMQLRSHTRKQQQLQDSGSGNHILDSQTQQSATATISKERLDKIHKNFLINHLKFQLEKCGKEKNRVDRIRLTHEIYHFILKYLEFMKNKKNGFKKFILVARAKAVLLIRELEVFLMEKENSLDDFINGKNTIDIINEFLNQTLEIEFVYDLNTKSYLYEFKTDRD
jgi:hypothetical protein